MSVMRHGPGQDFGNFYAMTGIAALVGIFTTMPAQPAILVPMAEAMAKASGWPLLSVVMTAVPTWSMMLFPYQGPPVVLAVALCNLRVAWVMKVLFIYFVIAAAVLLPLHFQWGRMLGYFGG